MSRITRRSFTLAGAGALAQACSPAQQPGPGSRPPQPRSDSRPRGTPAPAPGGQDELRGMWIASVAHTDWPSRAGLPPEQAREELTGLFDAAVRHGLNAVFLQVRPTADAFWPSPFEPWSHWLTGVQGRDPGWDPLDVAVTEAHTRGLQLHAWLNPYRVAVHADPALLAADHPARRHPEWVVSYGGRLYYNPGIPEVRAFSQDAMLHAAENYAVDGVHWDDYFYPYPVAGEVFDDEAAFAEHGAGFTDRGDWRRHNVDLLVREMRDRLRAARPDIAFGVSPFGIWRNSSTDPRGSDTRGGVQTYDDLYADVRGWVLDGLLDYVLPQVYWHIGFPAADYAVLVPWWAETAEGTGVALYVGEALYRAGDPAQPVAWQDPAELSRHLDLCADHPQVRGNAFFSATHVAADPLGAMTRVAGDHYGTAAPPRRRP